MEPFSSIREREYDEVQRELNSRKIPKLNALSEPYTLWQRIQLYTATANAPKIPIIETNYEVVEQADPFDQFDPPTTSREVSTKVVSDLPDNYLDDNKEPEFELKGDQPLAWEKLVNWINSDEPYFILKGHSGSGKSTLMKKLVSVSRKHFFYFTAPTNKATKVLATLINHQAKTIYSLLGLKMGYSEVEGHEETLQLTVPDDIVPLPRGSIVVVDEASMIPRMLVDYIDKHVQTQGICVIYVGDPAQLPPVGEVSSPAWRVTDNKSCKVLMKKVIRYDSELLDLATRIRIQLKNKDYTNPIEDDNDGTKGVWYLSKAEFEEHLLRDITPETFKTTKVICWRNKTVNYYNNIIRAKLGFTKPIEAKDIVALASPVSIDSKIIGNTDDEGVVVSTYDTFYKVRGLRVPVHKVLLDMGDTTLNLQIVQEGYEELDVLLSNLAREAREVRSGFQRKTKWREFWSIKEQFHKIRFYYSSTIHRIQGYTLVTAYVCVHDIFANRNYQERHRGLYVAVSRPTTRLICC